MMQPTAEGTEMPAPLLVRGRPAREGDQRDWGTPECRGTWAVGLGNFVPRTWPASNSSVAVSAADV